MYNDRVFPTTKIIQYLVFHFRKDDLKPPKPPAHQNEGCRVALNQRRVSQSFRLTEPNPKRQTQKTTRRDTRKPNQCFGSPPPTKKQLCSIDSMESAVGFLRVLFCELFENPLIMKTKRINEWQLKRGRKTQSLQFQC